MADVKAKDIVELIADDRGYSTKLDNATFNLGEWYGFQNEANKVLRVKYIFTNDKNGNYNIHKSTKELEENVELLVVIKIADRYNIFQVNKFTKNTIILDKELNIINSTDDIRILDDTYISDSSLYKLSKVNETIYGIYQRADKEKIDENAIKELFKYGNNECSYCGVTQEQIDELDQYEKSGYGLTIRARGKKMEVDQLNPKSGYTKGNIALCCYWCNNAKTDTFSVKEFKEIARGINIAWNIKIKNRASNTTICFPENSNIWSL